MPLDVRHYFDCVSHDVLLGLLAREVTDDGLLWLCRVLLEGAEVPGAAGEARGLPIGNLTSQFWANVYLDALDHHVRDDLGCGAYLRYMDDIVLFDDSKDRLWRLVAAIRRFCADPLRLEIKDEATVVAPVTEGLPWLGFRVFPGTVRVDAGGRRRFVRKMTTCGAAAGRDAVSDQQQRDRGASLCGHLRLGNTHAFRTGVIRMLDGTRPAR